MTFTSLRRLSGALGAELRGAELQKAYGSADIAHVKHALIDHLVVTLPERQLTLNDYPGQRRELFRTRVKGNEPVAA